MEDSSSASLTGETPTVEENLLLLSIVFRSLTT